MGIENATRNSKSAEILARYAAGEREFIDMNFGDQLLDFDNADLRDAIFRKSFILASFKSANLEGADFSTCNVKGCDFSGAKLSGANFRDSAISGALFDDADLMGADFENADYYGIIFEKGDLPIPRASGI